MLFANTIPELLTHRALDSHSNPAYYYLNTQQNWISIDWNNFQQKVHYIACELKERGLQKGQAIGIMASSNLQWELVHLAILTAGGIVVGLDPNERPEQLSQMIETAKIKGVVIDNLEQLKKIKDINTANFDFKITLNDHLNSKDFSSITDIISSQQKKNTSLISFDVKNDDIATIIFTSGTTGTPKGIAYSHKQILFACQNILDVYSNINESCRLVCWLPLSNLFQRILNLCALAGGAQTYFVENPRKIIEYLPQINPHIFIAVPRFYEKLYSELESQLNHQPRVLRNFINYSLTQAEGTGFKSQVFKNLNYILLKKFRHLFGSNIQYMVSGSAPMPLWLLKRYAAMNLLILEAYGLSENVLPIAVNRPHDYQFGSVGKVMSGNEVKLAEDDELLVRGLCVFDGYLGQDKLTANQNGYHASGDYAKVDSQGFIHLTGRKSEIFKTSTGRKIAPAAIETLITQAQGIDQAIIIGANKKFITAIITLEKNEPAADVVERLTTILHTLPSYKCPAGLIITVQGFSLAKNEITANLKFKRKNIQSNYSVLIEQLYKQLEDPDSSLQKQALIINSEISLHKIEKVS